MTSAQQTPTGESVPGAPPQTTPPGIGYGHPEYKFVESIMEMQKSLGQINSSIDNLRESVNGIKTKVDNLVAWKHMILGGAIVVGVMVSAISYLIARVSDYVTIKAPITQSEPTFQAPPPTVVPTKKKQ